MKNFYTSTILFFLIFHVYSQEERKTDPVLCQMGYESYYADGDGDGYGAGKAICLSSPQSGYVQNNSDCNDTDATVNLIDMWYRDNDGDGFGDPYQWTLSCIQPFGYVSDNNDCNDNDSGSIECSTEVNFSDENYVHHRLYKNPVTEPIVAPEAVDVIEEVTYYDGLGRPKQQVAIRQSPSQKDIVTHIEYDAVGRKARSYLPYISENPGSGFFKVDGKTKTENFYNKALYDFTTNPYSENFYDGSPLNIVVEQSAPGNAWKEGITEEHTIRKEQSLAVNTDSLRTLKISYLNGSPSLIDSGFHSRDSEYPAIFLKKVTKNENWKFSDGDNNTVHEFIDFNGRTILKRTFNNNQKHDTYYVYDDFDNLVYVIPPKASEKTIITTSVIEGLCYTYVYDSKNRVIKKMIPGKEWEYIVYDILNRPILTQDGNLRLDDKWFFTKYDVFDRVVFTGRYFYLPEGTDDNAARMEIQNIVDTQLNPQWNESKLQTGQSDLNIIYTNGAYPNDATKVELFTINFYDDYQGLTDTSLIVSPGSTVFTQPITSNTKSLPTWNKVKVLGTNHWITSVTYYDKKARMIQNISKNSYLGTKDVSRLNLDFSGKVLKTQTNHVRNGNNLMIIDAFTYDHMNRLLTQKQKIGSSGTWELIVNNEYDELGQLKSKKVGGAVASTPENSIGLQTIDYSYNIRGWLQEINDFNTMGNDLFGFRINYNEPQLAGTQALYNGNISETRWRTINDAGLSGPRSYKYQYDNLNRIIDAQFMGYQITDPNELVHAEDYSLSNVTYDRNGNILSLKRKGFFETDYGTFGIDYIDVLQYSYVGNSNKLKAVADTGEGEGFKDGMNSTPDYAYDINGNLTSDLNKGITNISYNHLNLPNLILVSGSNMPDGKIEYFYDAVGTKLKKEVSMGSNIIKTVEYAGGFIYENGDLKLFSHPEGYTEPDGQGGYNYVYQYKDHLGNIRLSYLDADGDYKSMAFHNFEQGTDGWQGTAENGRLKVTVQNQYSGVTKNFNEHFSSGESIDIKGLMDVFTTTLPIRVLVNERDANNASLGWYSLGIANNGEFDYSHTFVHDVENVLVKFDIATASNVQTQFFLDNLVIESGELEILEENNYYPFGLEHKGYNNVISNSNSVASKFKFQGVEYEESLGLNLYEMDFRNYDSALGRFTGIDPVTHHQFSPYNSFDNNPVIWSDPSGADATYGVDPDGKVRHLDDRKYYDSEGNEVDKIYATDRNQKIDFEKGSVTTKVNENGSSLASDLAHNSVNITHGAGGDQEFDRDMFIGVTDGSNKTEAFNTFKFLADNSNVEWSIVKFETTAGKDGYQIATYGLDGSTTGVNDSNGMEYAPKLQDRSAIYKGIMHSHGTDLNIQDRNESLSDQGDRGTAWQYQKNYGNFPYQVYHPKLSTMSSWNPQRFEFRKNLKFKTF
ncbi:MAG TPA: DUF6443 domain-containing protein [Salinimicrobium sp.]|nr:DUF6443 domain-containing protein [Salinimicrobium sp.]